MKKLTLILALTIILSSILSLYVSAAPQVGDPIGDVLYSDITAYINDSAIPTSAIGSNTYVAVEDLKNYGFKVKWDDKYKTLKVEFVKNKEFTPLEVIKDTVNKPGSVKCKYVYTNIRTYLSDIWVESYSINGKVLIKFDLLKKYGKITWDGKARELHLTIK